MGFISSFTGSQQRKDAKAGAAAQRTDLQAGYDKARPGLQAGYAAAKSTIDPFVTSGLKTNQMYQDTLGANGAEARDATQGIYFSDKVLSKLRQMDLEAQGRSDNAAGRFNSGVGAQADSAVRLRNYGNWQDRLKAEGDKGFQAAGLKAGLESQEGESVAGLDYGYGQQRAGITGQEYSNVAASRGIGVNNFMNLAALGINAFTPGKSGMSAAGSAFGSLNKMLGPAGSLT